MSIGSITAETLELIKEANRAKVQDDLAKAFTQATGLVNFDLQRPAKIIYPVITPLRNMIPRIKGNGGQSTNWRAILGINTALVAGGVSEGGRNAVISTNLKNYVATYKTIGLEDYVTFEAEEAAEGFDDANARMIEGLLRSTMIMEENAILGGNNSLLLGKPVTPVLADVATGGKITHDTDVFMMVLPLTHDGVRTGSVVNGVLGEVTRTNVDGSTDTFGGFSGEMSDEGTVSTADDATDTHCVTAYTTPIPGAMGYAWYWGGTTGAASLTLGAITNVNSVKVTTLAGTGTQTADLVGDDDYSTNDLLFDGILSLICGAGQFNPPAGTSGAYVVNNATGTPGTGTPLTSNDAGGIVEIEVDLKWFWDNYRLGPTHMLVNAQELANISTKCIAGGSAPLFRFVLDNVSGTPAVSNLTVAAGTVVGNYLNKYTMDGGQLVKVMLHPNVAPGTMVYLCEKLPYPLSNVSNPMHIRYRRDYYQIDWPLISRKRQKGVYASEVLAMEFPPAFGIRYNIANG